MTDIITELRKLVKDEKLVVGKERTLKILRTGGIEKIFIASNCPADLKGDLEHFSSVTGVEIIDTQLSNEELGNISKKPFSIAVLGLLK